MTAEIDRAIVLAESLRAMHRNAKHAYVSARPGAHHSITMDSTRLGDLTDAADLIEALAAALLPLANAAAPIEREMLTDADVERAQAVLYGKAVS